MAAKLVIEPIFEADFQTSSYGFRPKRSATQALEAIREAGNRGCNFVVDLVSPARNREVPGESYTSKIIVKPCAGKLHARFERGS